jgi:signal transduction histidine kinase/ligand-binding sensor domain-containing protein
MRLFTIFILTLIFISFCFPVKAQLDADKLMQFDELKGTPIRDIQPDSEGNIWIATPSGLIKFDGYKYTRFHPDISDSTTMGELLIYALYPDQQGYLWIGAQEAVYRYNPEYRSFTRFPFQDLTGVKAGNTSNITDIADNNRGRIYFSAYILFGGEGIHGLFYYDEKKKAMIPYELPEGINITSVYYMTPDPFGNIWMVTDVGFFKMDPLNQLHEIIPCPDNNCLEPNEGIMNMASDSTGKLWLVSTHNNFYTYEPATNELRRKKMDLPLAGDIFNLYADILIDEKQDIWLTSTQGLVRYNLKKSVYEVFDPASTDRLLRDQANSLAFDDFGNLWIGTESVGLLKYNPRSLLGSFVWDDNDPKSITSGWVKKMIEDDNGDIWVATSAPQHAGISRLDLKTKKVYPTPYTDISTSFNWDNVYAAMSKGKMLISAFFSGYHILDYRDMSVKDTTLSGLHDSLYLANIIRDSRSNIWFCTYSGLFKQSPDSDKKIHLDLTTIPGTNATSDNVTNLFESPGYGLWIMTDNGLFLYDYDSGEISRHGGDRESGQVFPSQDINSFYQGPDGICWVGTWQGGLCRYNPKTGEIKTYTTNEGLPSMSIQGILGDEKHQALWISTFAGISRFSIEEEQFNNFSLKDGIQGLLYADGQSLKTSIGYFLFGGNNGVTYFNPDDIAENTMPPITSITDFKVDDHAYSIHPGEANENSPFDLSYSQNNISIEYTGVQYDDPVKNKFAFMLENYDKSWREVGNQRSAYYYNLPPGSYTFKVKTANSHGVWNKEPVTLSFTINPPWWRTWWAYIIYGIVLIATIMIFDRFRKRRLLEKERQLAKEKELAQAKEIEKAYVELKNTQKQLIQSEKMASLGELTAGIAHEIQNPLNFINNFSEVNSELIAELNEEIEKGDMAEVKAIANDIAQNEQKISHHGKRADSIVKGMLQHSRSSSGVKELTDINALADEYLRLAYHGLRAKDKSFNATMKTDFDETIGKINVIPQDIGRVILNLITNAFYAVSEKKQQLPVGYEPTVTVSTRISPTGGGKGVEISVKDNGNGIPEQIKEKIFQPFFTTKPTGQGTGLGLSMSYDIIKAHGGEIKVETQPDMGTEFIIQLPIDQL